MTVTSSDLGTMCHSEVWEGNLGGEVEVDGDDVHVTLVGEIDVACSETMQRRLDEVSELTVGAVLLDMSGVSFIDSTGIRVLVTSAGSCATRVVR